MKKFVLIVGSVFVLFLLIINLTKPTKVINNQEKLITGYIKTEKASLTLPCSAYLDGIDKNANLTIMLIPIYDSPGRIGISHKLLHGSSIEVLGYLKNAEGQIIFKINTGVDIGWVSNLFISDKENKPIGDRI